MGKQVGRVLSSRLELAQVTLDALRRNLLCERHFACNSTRYGTSYRWDVIYKITQAHPILNINRSQDKYAIY